VIVQDDHLDTDSVIICSFTTDPTEAQLFRLEIEPSTANGLDAASRLMVDKITTVRRSKNRCGDWHFYSGTRGRPSQSRHQLTSCTQADMQNPSEHLYASH